MAALYARQRTGRGQKIDVSLLESQVATLVNIASNYLIGGVEAKRWGTAHESIVPYQVRASAWQMSPAGKSAERGDRRLLRTMATSSSAVATTRTLEGCVAPSACQS